MKRLHRPNIGMPLPPPQFRLDRFGFLVTSEKVDDAAVKRYSLVLETVRLIIADRRSEVGNR